MIGENLGAPPDSVPGLEASHTILLDPHAAGQDTTMDCTATAGSAVSDDEPEICPPQPGDILQA